MWEVLAYIATENLAAFSCSPSKERHGKIKFNWLHVQWKSSL
jgi:hypothetical protein